MFHHILKSQHHFTWIVLKNLFHKFSISQMVTHFIAGNTLAAYIGELEDRLTRGSAPPVDDRGMQRPVEPADGKTQP